MPTAAVAAASRDAYACCCCYLEPALCVRGLALSQTEEEAGMCVWGEVACFVSSAAPRGGHPSVPQILCSLPTQHTHITLNGIRSRGRRATPRGRQPPRWKKSRGARPTDPQLHCASPGVRADPLSLGAVRQHDTRPCSDRRTHRWPPAHHPYVLRLNALPRVPPLSSRTPRPQAESTHRSPSLRSASLSPVQQRTTIANRPRSAGRLVAAATTLRSS